MNMIIIMIVMVDDDGWWWLMMVSNVWSEPVMDNYSYWLMVMVYWILIIGLIHGWCGWTNDEDGDWWLVYNG